MIQKPYGEIEFVFVARGRTLPLNERILLAAVSVAVGGIGVMCGHLIYQAIRYIVTGGW